VCSRALQCELALVRLLSATVSPSRVLSAQDKIGQQVSREAMAKKGLTDKDRIEPKGDLRGLWLRIHSSSVRLVVHVVSILPS
jgi:hypothetical protein